MPTRFEFKPITRPVTLADYAPEYDGATFQVWVNMPRAVMSDFGRLQDDAATVQSNPIIADDVFERMCQWYATIWSQGDDPATHFTSDDVKQLINHLSDTDPQAWPWLSMRVQQTIANYRMAERKN